MQGMDHNRAATGQKRQNHSEKHFVFQHVRRHPATRAAAPAERREYGGALKSLEDHRHRCTFGLELSGIAA